MTVPFCLAIIRHLCVSDLSTRCFGCHVFTSFRTLFSTVWLNSLINIRNKRCKRNICFVPSRGVIFHLPLHARSGINAVHETKWNETNSKTNWGGKIGAYILSWRHQLHRFNIMISIKCVIFSSSSCLLRVPVPAQQAQPVSGAAPFELSGWHVTITTANMYESNPGSGSNPGNVINSSSSSSWPIGTYWKARRRRKKGIARAQPTQFGRLWDIGLASSFHPPTSQPKYTNSIWWRYVFMVYMFYDYLGTQHHHQTLSMACNTEE